MRATWRRTAALKQFFLHFLCRLEFNPSLILLKHVLNLHHANLNGYYEYMSTFWLNWVTH